MLILGNSLLKYFVLSAMQWEYRLSLLINRAGSPQLVNNEDSFLAVSFAASVCYCHVLLKLQTEQNVDDQHFALYKTAIKKLCFKVVRVTFAKAR